MDPHANLAEQCETARSLIRTADAAGEAGMSDGDRRANEDRGERLAELILALDGWRRGGGWDPYQPANARDDDPQSATITLRELSTITYGSEHGLVEDLVARVLVLRELQGQVA